MYKEEKVIAVIVAAGRGNRFGGELPKQFVKLGSKTVLETAVEAFDSHSAVDEIYVAAARDRIDLCGRLCRKYSKVVEIVPGGAQRQDSVYEGIKKATEGIILVHDSARPYVSEAVIDRVISQAYNQGASVPCVPVKDTVRKVTEHGSETLRRDELYSVQTPQGFRTELLMKAFDKAYETGFYGTDEGSLVENLGEYVGITEGDYANIKITTVEDVKHNMDVRAGHGYDVHRLAENRDLYLCGVKIPYEYGLLGHSDADVALHALMDALLGAAGLGDIGKYFPDTEERYRGVSSLKLLEEVKALIEDKGFAISNVDITVVAQKPKIAEYIQTMRRTVASELGMDFERVNIKGTTTEKLGFTGRCEGIAAEAVCILYR